MKMNWYQEACIRTLKTDYEDIKPNEIEILNLAGCIAEEAGEVYGTLKKQLVHRHGLDESKVAEEIGDCLWYIANLCTKLGLDMDDVMTNNIDKLNKRYPEGFSAKDSMIRKDEEIG